MKTVSKNALLPMFLAGLGVILIGILSGLYISDSGSSQYNRVESGPPTETWEKEVRNGDINFDFSDYGSALFHYQNAKEKIQRASSFEEKAPLGKKDLRQYYYNKEKFIDARLELTMICLELNERQNRPVRIKNAR
jgi:hypothetical protein